MYNSVIDQIQVRVRFVDRDMSLRYHWGLGVGHTYHPYPRHHPHLQLPVPVRSPPPPNFASTDNVDDDEAAELMLVDREALDWEEDSENEETEKVLEHEWDSMDMHSELGSDPEWIDAED